MSWRAEFLVLLLLPVAVPAAADEFLPDNLPARSAALGGNTVADPQGAAAGQENLAGLSLDGDDLWVRYQSVALDVPSDLGQGALEMRWNALPGFGIGILWQHLFDDVLARDRLRLGVGVDLGEWIGLKGLRLGLGLDHLEQQYTLDPDFTYAGLASTHAEAYDAAAGLLWEPCPWFSFGAAADQLTRPNLGLVGPDVFDPVFTWDGGFHLPLWSDGVLYLHFGQMWDDEGPIQQAGAEWSSPGDRLALRVGSDGTTLSVGTGFKVGSLHLDYVYRFGLSAEAAAFGGGQGVDLGLDFGAPGVAVSSVPQALPTPLPVAVIVPPVPPSPTPTPPRPDMARVEVGQAIAQWDSGQRRRALETISEAVHGRDDLPTATALKTAWQRALAVPTPTPTPAADVEAGLAEAQAFRAQGRDDLARETLKSILKAAPGQGEAKAALRALNHPVVTRAARAKSKKLFEKGLRLYEAGLRDGALDAWEKALKLDPGNMEALNSLTRARIQGGKPH